MAENDSQTVLVPSGSAAASGSTHPSTSTAPFQPAGDSRPDWVSTPAGGPGYSPVTSTPVAEPVHSPAAGGTAPEYGVMPGPDGPVPPQRRPSLADRLRTPIAGAILGGVVILGAGFGAGYVVGKDTGGSSSSTTVPGGQTGQFGPGGPGGGQFGGGPGGFGGQGQTGQSQQGAQGGVTQGGTTQYQTGTTTGLTGTQ